MISRPKHCENIDMSILQQSNSKDSGFSLLENTLFDNIRKY